MMSLLTTTWLMIKLAAVYFTTLSSTLSLLLILVALKYGMPLTVPYKVFSATQHRKTSLVCVWITDAASFSSVTKVVEFTASTSRMELE